MASSFSLMAILFSLALYATMTTESRKDTGEYWQDVAKYEQPQDAAIQTHGDVKSDCDTSHANHKLYAKDFKPRPNISSYNDDSKLNNESNSAKDFEPRPNISAYSDDSASDKEDKSFVKDFEPRPNISMYQG